MQRIDGKALAQTLRADIRKECIALKERNIVPGLAVVLVGHDPASEIYVRNKEKGCDEVGIYSRKHVLPENTSEEALLELIAELNEDDSIDGILVQLPLPKHIDEDRIIDAIHADKDVDGFSPANVGNLLIGKEAFEPCTPRGCMALIESAGIKPEGKKAVVIGRSNIVGKPVAILLLAQNATVTICHSRTRDLKKELEDADIVIVAIGKEKFLTPDMIKDGATVIDVGINRGADGKVYGDADYAAFEAVDKDCAITPVPGGVGPMTITMLLENTVLSAKRRHNV